MCASFYSTTVEAEGREWEDKEEMAHGNLSPLVFLQIRFLEKTAFKQRGFLKKRKKINKEVFMARIQKIHPKSLVKSTQCPMASQPGLGLGGYHHQLQSIIRPPAWLGGHSTSGLRYPE